MAQRQIAAEVRGCGKVKHRDLLGKKLSYLLGHNSYSMRGASEFLENYLECGALLLMSAEAVSESSTAQSKDFHT